MTAGPSTQFFSKKLMVTKKHLNLVGLIITKTKPNQVRLKAKEIEGIVFNLADLEKELNQLTDPRDPRGLKSIEVFIAKCSIDL